MALSFPKKRKLARRGEFQRVKDEGRSHSGRLLLLGVLEGRESWRAGFITPKRLGTAVVRNRLRRQLREIVRLHQEKIRPDVWIVLVARMQSAGAAYETLEKEWLRLAGRAAILEKRPETGS